MLALLRITAQVTLCLLTAALVVLWVRSYWVGETYHVYDEGAGREYNAVSTRGRLSFYREAWDPKRMVLPLVIQETHEVVSDFRRDGPGPRLVPDPDPNPPAPPRRDFSRQKPYSLDGRAQYLWLEPAMKGFGPWLGIAYFYQPRPEMAGVFRELMVPYWLLTLGAGAPAAWLLRRQLRSRRAAAWRAAGRCAICGYDLHATPGRCPECGSEQSAAPAATLDPTAPPA